MLHNPPLFFHRPPRSLLSHEHRLNNRPTANQQGRIERLLGNHDGFVKIVADAQYGEIPGVHILGPQATEPIAEAVALMELEGTVEEMMFAIHAHPTLAESMLDAYGAVEGMAINACGSGVSVVSGASEC